MLNTRGNCYSIESMGFSIAIPNTIHLAVVKCGTMFT